MQELSLNILDIAENSVSAGATRLEIELRYAFGAENRLTVTIRDNGHGMSEETAQRVADPFYTTRTTRKVGLGTAFFKLAAELTGGSLSVAAKLGEGTVVTAILDPTHLDAVPLGDLAATCAALVQTSPEMELCLTVSREDTGAAFTADTARFREILGEIPLDSPEVLRFLSDFIRENLAELLAGSPLEGTAD